MNIPIIGAVADVFSDLIGLGKELIEDKDKRNEYAFRLAELRVQLAEKMLTQQTHPKADAAVKLLYAFKEILLPMMRPVGSLLLALWGASHPEQIKWLHDNLGTLGDGTILSIFGAFPAWGVSRHIEKNRKQ